MANRLNIAHGAVSMRMDSTRGLELKYPGNDEWSSLTGLVNVKDFNARGDGTTNDTTAFQNALLSARGKTLVVPPGRYILTGPLVLTGEGGNTRASEIIGYGQPQLVFTSATDGFQVNSTGVGFSRVRMQGLFIISTNAAGGQAVNIDNINNSSFDEVHISTEGVGSWTHGYHVSTSESNVWRGGTISSAFGGIQNLFEAGASVTASTIVGLRASGSTGTTHATQRCFYIREDARFNILGGVAQGHVTVAGVDVDGNGNSPSVTAIGLHCETTSGGGVGYRYDNTGVNGNLTILGMHQGSSGGTGISAAPVNTTRGLSVFGGLCTGNIVLGAGLTTSFIYLAKLFGGTVTNGSTTPVIIGTITLGAADSGGTGFKALVVPN